MTLVDVDAAVKAGQNKIATLGLAKAYDKVNRELLIEDCKKVLDGDTISML